LEVAIRTQDAGPVGDFEPVAQGDITGEGLVEVDRAILLVRQAPGQAALAGAIVGIGREPRGEAEILHMGEAGSIGDS
jgi:hypothetical protein